MKIIFDEYHGYLSKKQFIDFCKNNGVIINKEYLDFLLKNKIINPEKLKTDNKGNSIYKIKKAHIIGVVTAMKYNTINIYNFNGLKKKYTYIVRDFNKGLDKIIEVSYKIDEAVNKILAFKYKKLFEFQEQTNTLKDRNNLWDDYVITSEDFNGEGFNKYVKNGCNEFLKELNIDLKYLDSLRFKIAKLTFFNRNELNKIAKIRYLKKVDENDLINSEYFNELIYKINLFINALGYGDRTVREVLLDIKNNKERACIECGKLFNYKRITQITCCNTCSQDHKNRLKREKK